MNRARYYNPRSGRFLSEDPIGFAGGDYNLYRYVGNNPVKSIDAYGLQSFDPVFASVVQYEAEKINSIVDGATTVTNTAVNIAVGSAVAGGLIYASVVAPEIGVPATVAAVEGFVEGYTGDGTGLPTLNPLEVALSYVGQETGKKIKKSCKSR